MTATPDDSSFTAAVLGEVSACDGAAFRAGLAENPAWPQEAAAISRTAGLLGAALRQEPLVCLTIPQRQAVLHPERRTVPPAAGRRVWLAPTLVTAGIAAAVAVGLIVLPGGPGGTRGGGDSSPGLPSIAVQPGAPEKSGLRPVTPLPGMVNGLRLENPLPQAAPPLAPVPLKTPESMAASPPVVNGLSVPAVPKLNPAKADGPPGKSVRPGPGKLRPEESLGGSAPPK